MRRSQGISGVGRYMYVSSGKREGGRERRWRGTEGKRDSASEER